MSLGVASPAAGRYAVRCRISGSTDTDGVYETGQHDLLHILDSYTVEVVAARLEQEEDGWRATLTLANLPASTQEVSCFYRRAATLEGGLLGRAAVQAGDTVDCGVVQPGGGGVYQLGATLLPSKRALTNVKLSVAEQTIMTEGPAPLRAKLTKNLAAVRVKFDKNLQGSSDCTRIFTADTLARLGSEPKCSFSADKLEVEMGRGMSLRFGDNLAFQPGNGVRELRAEPEFAGEVTGSVTVATPADPAARYTPHFSLTGPAKLCTAGDFTLSLADLVGFGRGAVSLNWTVEPVTAALLALLPVAATGPVSLNIPADTLEADTEYVVSVVGSNYLGLPSLPRSLPVTRPAAGPGLSVQLAGPRRARADRKLRLRALATECNSSSETGDQPPKFRYFWSVDGPLTLAKKSSKSLKLEAGQLQGGRSYNFSVVVLGEGGAGQGSAWHSLSVARLGPRARLAATKLTFGAGNPVVLDATLSEDRDNSAGQLQFQWRCSAAEGGGCFVYSGPGPVRLEEAVGAELLRQDYSSLPAATLSPATYNFTVTVTKVNCSVLKKPYSVLFFLVAQQLYTQCCSSAVRCPSHFFSKV